MKERSNRLARLTSTQFCLFYAISLSSSFSFWYCEKENNETFSGLTS